ncbi:siroheme synthase CysG [Xanthobacter agilis]|uniref:siroheme synthase CysG n=1 Tax=Xanthobacter agilis TaxID=47492 RepID=UPI003727401C
MVHANAANDGVATTLHPARVEPLAVLPVFLRLQGKSALVAGGSDAAAWKAELLHAAGARVEVHAAILSEAMAALVAEGRAVHAGASWREAALGAFTVAVADLDPPEAEAFAAAARRAGVAANVIDQPALCAFQFGSIVNRSPVVVGISTDGTAPVLGQAIRRRIETLLPRHLAAWGALAGRIRQRVAALRPSAAERRRFWETFAERAFAASGGPEEGAWPDARPGTEGGSVTLVGAGPGDPEYLTLKGMRALQSADVILFDDLVSPELLELARREAKRMLVGKRGGRESCRQEEINALMLRFARQGKRVVRLKAGDPSVFGRAGEEIAALEAAGIPVRVVPGITTASALAAGLNTSPTHRDAAQAVRFVTGHSRQGVLPNTIDWRAVADPATTTVFYMGGRTAPEIATRLLGAGMAPTTPVVIAANVSRANERRWSGPLAELADGMAAIGHDDPVLIGIGRVFAPRAVAAPAVPCPVYAAG